MKTCHFDVKLNQKMRLKNEDDCIINNFPRSSRK